MAADSFTTRLTTDRAALEAANIRAILDSEAQADALMEELDSALEVRRHVYGRAKGPPHGSEQIDVSIAHWTLVSYRGHPTDSRSTHTGFILQTDSVCFGLLRTNSTSNS